MKTGRIILLLAVIGVFSSCTKRNPGLVVVCGWDEVFISDITLEVPVKVWSWTADDSDGLPASMRNKFLTTDECKSMNNGGQILITSSGGGVVLLNRTDKAVLFYANLPNAHSAEILPGERLAVAASYSQEGNRVNIYNIDAPGLPVFTDSLLGAHGVIWDNKSDILWALGEKELRKYSLVDWDGDKPSLKLENSYYLPDDGGHDLQFHKKSNDLVITTLENVWIFDVKTGMFSEHPVLAKETNVKSVSYNRLTNETAYVKSTDENWWAFYIRFAGSDKVVYLPYERIYKVRWLY